jgi:hypothetical protein
MINSKRLKFAPYSKMPISIIFHGMHFLKISYVTNDAYFFFEKLNFSL